MDPKLFPRKVRHSALLTVNIYVFMGNMYSSGLATGFDSLAEDLKVNNNKLSALIAYAVLTQGLANLFWMPLALCFGKRLAVLLSMAMFLGGVIWSAVAEDYNSLLASRVFANFGSGSVESLGPSILADLFHERSYSSAMAIYTAFLSGGSQIGPMIAGYLIQACGWRWFFILCAIIAAVNLTTTVFLLPETTFEDKAEEPGLPNVEKNHTSHIETIHDVPDTQAYLQRDSSANIKALFSFGVSEEARKRGIFQHYAYLFMLPLPLLFIPGVFIASLMYGVVLGGVIIISTIAPDAFSPPPYNFSSADLGLFTFSSFIGIIIAWPIAGPMTDLLSRWLRKRSNNIHRPEHRLPALGFPFLVCPVGLIVFGYTVSRHEHYIRAAVGATISTASLTLVPAVMLSYVVDSYPRISGEALVLVNASKNVVAFGLVKTAYAWMADQGVDKMFYELAGTQWVILELAMPLYFAGPWLRSRAQNVALLARPRED